MTGFGKAVAEFPEKNVVIEVKSLNSKQLDLNARITHLYREKELEIRNIISEKLVRGKVDISVYNEFKDTTNVRTINEKVVSAYVSQLQNIDANLSGADALTIAMRLPDVLSAENVVVLEDAEWQIVKNTLLEACKNITEYREQEGVAMQKDISGNIATIQKALVEIEQFESKRVVKIKERIRTTLEELMGAENINENRLEQEMIFYVEKLDINEEKVRLTQHCNFFLETMQVEASGKKLGFIAQEIGREINTIGSKSNDADMQKIVVLMKDNLEKIKEQLLNIL